MAPSAATHGAESLGRRMLGLARRISRWVFCALALAGAPQARAAVLAPFQETAVITGLTSPTAVRFAPDGRIFVAEQSGLLKVFNGLGDNTADVAADLRTNVMNNWDRGFLGLAVDPQFPAPGHDYVYVLYSVDAPPGQTPPIWNDSCGDQTTNGCVTRGRLSRLQIGANNLQVGPEQILVDDRWCFQFPSHSIGDLRFGPEGALYLTAGDGASFTFTDRGQNGNPCGDPVNAGGALRSQDILTSSDPQTWNGNLLRLDVSGPTAVPWPTNPTVGTGAPDDDAIVAHGFRNPFRFTIHPGPGPNAGEVFVGDVGWDIWEEVNRVTAPNGPLTNFGWPCYEGGSGTTLRNNSYDNANVPLCEGLYDGTYPSNVVAPFYAYRHDQQVIGNESCGIGGSSVSGLAVYLSGSYPAEYQGALFFQDYTRRCLWAFMPNAPGGAPVAANRRAIGWGMSGAVDLQVGPGGDLYYAELGAGRIVRLSYFAANAPPVAQLVATPSAGPTPLAVAFNASGSSDPDPGDSLTYAWDLDGDGQFDDPPDADPRFAHFTYTQAGAVTVSVRVTDSQLMSSVATQVVTAANSPPVATILTPLDTDLWRVGDQILYSGRGDDPEQGQLPAGALSWRIVLHHCATVIDCHQHQLETHAGIAEGILNAPDHGYPSYLEFQLTATDSGSDWFDSAWSSRRRVRFSNGTQATNLSGFPVLLRLTSATIDYAKTQSAGQDLRFVDAAGGAPLPHQIEVWDESGTSLVWVRVPVIDAASSTDSILMYYGNPSAPDGQNPTGVWDSSFAGVWHMSSTNDSTANANTGVNNGTGAATGKIGGARSFDGVSWIQVASSPSLALAGNITLEAWIQIADPGRNVAARILDKKTNFDGPTGYELEYHAANDFVTALGSGGDWGRAAGVDLDTQWHLVSAAITGATVQFFVDGVDRTSDPSISPVAGGSLALNIGRNPVGAYFLGNIDELRISNVARSADWMRAQYLSMNGSFASIQPEELSTGLTGLASVLLQPQTYQLALQSSPPGLQLSAGEDTQTTPFSHTVIANSMTSISAPSPQSLGGNQQIFTSWSDAGAQSHEVLASQSVTGFTATFVSANCGNGALDPGEECDDNNIFSGDCCTTLCRLEPTGSPCSDGVTCTVGDSCSAGVCGGLPAPDDDLDGSCTLADNCPYTPNPGQADTGGIGATAPPDGHGDACQCGDLGGEGIVDANDVTAYRNHLSDPAAYPLSATAQAKCSVFGADPAVCDLADLVVLRRALEGLGPSVGQVCSAASAP